MRTPIFNVRFRPFLNRLLMELLDCWQRRSPELLRVESAYMITLKHWKDVKNECWQRSFECEEEEIDFFKNLKCQFTGRLAYYTILYEALVSAPQEYNPRQIYWQQELDRFERFEEKNAEFLQYLGSGENEFDREYFLRKNMSAGIPVHAKLYDGDREFCTRYDHLVSAYFAEKLYRYFVLGQLHS